MESKLIYPARMMATSKKNVLKIPVKAKPTLISKKLFRPLQKKTPTFGHKVTIVGCGQVGMAIAFALLTQKVSNNIALVDADKRKLQGEKWDLLHGSMFLDSPKITASTDYAGTKNSQVCVIASGVRQKKGQTRLDIVQQNADIIKKVVPEIVKYSPKTVIILASNPVDVLAYVTWKISGLPMYSVIGSGTNLDSARFRYMLAKILAVAPTSVHGYIIGEHGISCVPVWSGVNIAGVRLVDLNPSVGSEKDPDNFGDIYKKVVIGGPAVRMRKGYTNWAVALSVVQIIAAILQNSHAVYPVSTNAKGFHRIEHDIFLSLPCVLGSRGVQDVVIQPLTDYETKKLHESAEILLKTQCSVKI